VFLTTQYLEEANELCDRLAILQDGQITHTGTPAALKSAVGTETITVALKDPSADQRRRAMRILRQINTLDAAAIEKTADGLTIEADNARAATSELFTELAAADITVTDFDVQSPTLDDVFLTLAGADDANESRATNEPAGAQEVVR
jgi:ABC-2 type transport system ATP-binding protein